MDSTLVSETIAGLNAIDIEEVTFAIKNYDRDLEKVLPILQVLLRAERKRDQFDVAYLVCREAIRIAVGCHSTTIKNLAAGELKRREDGFVRRELYRLAAILILLLVGLRVGDYVDALPLQEARDYLSWLKALALRFDAQRELLEIRIPKSKQKRPILPDLNHSWRPGTPIRRTRAPFQSELNLGDTSAFEVERIQSLRVVPVRADGTVELDHPGVSAVASEPLVYGSRFAIRLDLAGFGENRGIIRFKLIAEEGRKCFQHERGERYELGYSAPVEWEPRDKSGRYAISVVEHLALPMNGFLEIIPVIDDREYSAFTWPVTFEPIRFDEGDGV